MATHNVMDVTALRTELQPVAAFTDGQVVAGVVAGDHPLFEFIMRRYNRRLYRVAWSVLRDEALAQDVLHKAYIVAFTQLAQFRGPHGLGAWLSQILRRSALRVRDKRQRLESVDDIADHPAADQPDRQAANDEAAHLIEAAVAKLALPFRMVFILREIEELSFEETAESLEISTGTVKSRLHRAKRKLRRLLGKDMLDGEAGTTPEPFAFAGRRCDAIVGCLRYSTRTDSSTVSRLTVAVAAHKYPIVKEG